jgi:hypothetical protein
MEKTLKLSPSDNLINEILKESAYSTERIVLADESKIFLPIVKNNPKQFWMNPNQIQEDIIIGLNQRMFNFSYKWEREWKKVNEEKYPTANNHRR